MRSGDTPHGYLDEGERLALVSALRELSVAALQLFDPGRPIAEFMLRLAERLNCVATVCLELDPDQGLQLVGAGGLSERSRALPIAAPESLRDGAGRVDWARFALPYPELEPADLHRWIIRVNEPSTEEPGRAVLLYFLHEPAHPRQVRGMLEQLVPMVGTALGHRRLYARLLEQNALMHSLFEASSQGILIVSADGRLLSYNQRFVELWGLGSLEPGARIDAALRGLAELVVEPERFLGAAANLRGDTATEQTDEIALRDGRTFERFTAPIRGPLGHFGRGWYFRDVSARKEVEDDRTRLLLQEQAARAAAEEAVKVRDEFLSVAAHELKTPLTPLSLRLAAIARQARAGLPIDPTLVDRARASLRRMATLINDLLDVTRLEAGRLRLEMRTCRLDELLDDVLRDFRLVGPRHQIVVDRASASLVRGDPARLEQVVTNLIENALKYSPAGGTIHVRLEEHEDQAVLTVTDPGIGIPEDQQRLLFERFFRGRNAPITAYGGLGLGLYICRDIVARHGGRIWFESKVGVGSSFHVALPLLAPARRSEGPAHAGA